MSPESYERKFRVERGSLTDGNEDILVNASNTNGNLGSGVSGAIRVACGPDFQQQVHDTLNSTFGGPMQPGQVLITHAGSHPRATHVAHVAVMDYRHGFQGSSFPTLDLIRTCTTNLWRAIEGLESSSRYSVAMVALGAGTGNLGLRGTTEIACHTLLQHLREKPNSRIGDVTFYGFQLHEYLVTAEMVVDLLGLDEQSFPEDVQDYLKTKRQQDGR
ncbi:MAG: hypothetical protein A2289_21725 [Deltaproteobacteria bacterium RIFOXYA12_FULL_58_15]|nr:MAG: hypothetical protein A2289_21725 [Deltaproteobacteria bacterium RIFOXYA12_FULL_58_15]OGR09533.1 MAG: hypothetical protein A2341_16600 [Deltaproteobacteria bacterium RIFOXYB12_FULL_58_9]